MYKYITCCTRTLYAIQLSTENSDRIEFISSFSKQFFCNLQMEVLQLPHPTQVLHPEVQLQARLLLLQLQVHQVLEQRLEIKIPQQIPIKIKTQIIQPRTIKCQIRTTLCRHGLGRCTNSGNRKKMAKTMTKIDHFEFEFSNTGLRGSLDQLWGMTMNVGMSLGNMVNNIVSETFNAVGSLVDNIFGMGVINRYNTPSYNNQIA